MEHLWDLGRALQPKDEAAVAQWIEPRCQQLRHRRQQRVLREIAEFKAPRRPAEAVVEREAKYFAGHA